MDLTGKRILVVDDEEDLVQLLKSVFEANGAQVDTALGGEEAYDKFQSQTFDFIFTDVRMPDGDGISLLNRIRKTHPKEPPVVLVTGHSDVSPKQSVELGAARMFPKPIDWDQLYGFMRSQV